VFYFIACFPYNTVADPDFELMGGHSFVLLALPAFLPSVISSFSTQNKGGGEGPGPPSPSPRSATVTYMCYPHQVAIWCVNLRSRVERPRGCLLFGFQVKRQLVTIIKE